MVDGWLLVIEIKSSWYWLSIIGDDWWLMATCCLLLIYYWRLVMSDGYWSLVCIADSAYWWFKCDEILNDDWLLIID